MVINTGIVGYGSIAESHHARVLGDRPDRFRLTAVCDPTESRRSAAVRHHGVSVFSDIDAFLAADVDLVIVATPTLYHAESALAAVRAGKHVVMEKPMGKNHTELAAVIDSARENGVILTVHHNRRRDPDYLAVKAIIERGDIGNIILFESKANGIGNPLGAGAGDYLPEWRLQQSFGGGKINEWGSHLIDQALQIFGTDIDSVWGHLVAVGLSDEVDTYGTYAIKFRSGVLCRIETSWISPFPEPRWYALGTSGALLKHSMASDEPVTVVVRDPASQDLGVETKERCPESSHDSFYDDLYETLAHGAGLAVMPEEGAMVVQVIDAVRESTRTGEAVRFRG